MPNILFFKLITTSYYFNSCVEIKNDPTIVVI